MLNEISTNSTQQYVYNQGSLKELYWAPPSHQAHYLSNPIVV